MTGIGASIGEEKGEGSNANNNVEMAARDIKQHGPVRNALVNLGGVVNIGGDVHIISHDKKLDPVNLGSIPGQERDYVTLSNEPWPVDEPKDEDEAPNKLPLRSVAAVYRSSFKFRVYFQKDLIIYEGSYIEGGWSISAHIDASDARENTPIAAVSYAGGSKIHLFYITRHNVIHELCWSAEKGWKTGSLTAKAPRVSPYSSLSATCSAHAIKVYCQRGNMVCELSYQFFPGNWTYKPLIEALRGTCITSTSYPGEENTIYCVYFQDEGLYLQEYIYELQHELDSDMPEIQLPAYTPLAALSWYIDDPYIRLYYVSDDWHIRELPKDEEEEWNDPYDLRASQTVEKNSQIAALEQNDGKLIRIYYLLSTGELVQTSFSKTHDEETPGIDSVL